MIRVGIVTITNDLHALYVSSVLRQHGAKCHIMVCDRLAESTAISWNLEQEGDVSGGLSDTDGAIVDIGELDVVWWRRVNATIQPPSAVTNAHHVDLIQRDWRATLHGLFLTSFRGAWVSDPLCTTRAENKLYQLVVARACGFRVPRTLVSNDPEQIRRFCEQLDNRVVVKPVRGTLMAPLFSRQLALKHLNV